jgi:succinate dehydrogenase/fumarate reductase cytochrome b subunit
MFWDNRVWKFESKYVNFHKLYLYYFFILYAMILSMYFKSTITDSKYVYWITNLLDNSQGTICDVLFALIHQLSWYFFILYAMILSMYFKSMSSDSKYVYWITNLLDNSQGTICDVLFALIHQLSWYFFRRIMTHLKKSLYYYKI